MTSHCVPRLDSPAIDTTIFGAASLLALAMGTDDTPRARPAGRTGHRAGPGEAAAIGVWTARDGGVRLELCANGRYGLDIAGRHRRTAGTYRADRLCVLLEADGGLRTVAQLDGEVLELAGHRLRRERRD